LEKYLLEDRKEIRYRLRG